MKKKVLLGVVGVAGLWVILMAVLSFAAPVTVSFINPHDMPVTIQTAGARPQTLRPGETTWLEVDRSGAEVHVDIGGKGVATRKIAVPEGFLPPWNHDVAPLADDQCLALFDVTESHYGPKTWLGIGLPGQKDKPAGAPKLLKQSGVGEFFTTPEHTSITEARLPHSVKDGDTAHLVMEIPCAAGNDVLSAVNWGR